ncbi:MAG: hypothetical protein HYX24_05265 [Candidatus Aenigmarchaeota archaeon]|nr:hypothetical protein [Candidatus Aenigmarchaeota archaeon]
MMFPIKLIAQKVDIFPSDGKHQFARTGQLAFHHLKAARKPPNPQDQ